VESLAILLINAPSPRKTNSNARKMMKMMMRPRKRSSSKIRQAKEVSQKEEWERIHC
jgi:hypothetical protein